jgi:hypothetical protein
VPAGILPCPPYRIYQAFGEHQGHVGRPAFWRIAHIGRPSLNCVENFLQGDFIRVLSNHQGSVNSRQIVESCLARALAGA